jgi:hypothetical protein
MLLMLVGSSFAGELFVSAQAGPAYATYFPIDEAGVAEHLAVHGTQSAVGVGRGTALGGARLDLGVRLQHIHEHIAGAYAADERDDAYQANYDYVALLASANVASSPRGRVGALAGLTLGTARLFSDRQGEALHSHPIPVFGTFELGLGLRLVEGVEAQGSLSWVPPVAKMNVLSPQVGLRVKL